MRIAPFSNRLAHAVPSNVQGLRCFANFEALRFSNSIRLLADKMVDRMVKSSSHSGGKYVSVHLRFEEVLFFIFLYELLNFPVAVFSVSSKCNFSFQRIWLLFHAVNMMVGRKRNMKWILLEKEAGEENSGEGVE